MAVGAALTQICGDDLPFIEGPAAVGGSQRGSAFFQVPGFVAVLSGAAYGDGVDAVGVAITGAVVPFSPTIPRGPNKNGAQTLATLFNAILESLFSQPAWSIYCLSVIIGSPTGAVNVNVVGSDAQRLGLHHIGHIAVQHPDASYLCIICDAHDAVGVVGRGSDFTRTASAMFVLVAGVISRGWVIIISIDIVACIGIVVGGQVWVIPFYAVIEDGDDHILSCVATLPRRLDVHL